MKEYKIQIREVLVMSITTEAESAGSIGQGAAE
jgi:hypothetical protein